MNREEILDQSISEISDSEKNNRNEADIVAKVYDNFMNKQIQKFPEMCQHAHMVNFQEEQFLRNYGNKGKYTDSYGWSENREFKHKWLVPTELRLFMQNLVYRDFWDDSNSKVRDSFMKQVCKGGTKQDFVKLLNKVLVYYNGANAFKFS